MRQALAQLHVIYLQPSELFKLFTVLFIAWLVQYHHDELGHWRQLAVWTLPSPRVRPHRHRTGHRHVIGGGGDRVAMLCVGACRGRCSGESPYSVSLFSGPTWRTSRTRRTVAVVLAPEHPSPRGGYQLLQSRIGLGAGGVGGLGLGHSREKWGLLPNPHTDFIFTIVGEELGLIGTLLVIALFVAFLFAAVRIAQQCTNSVYRLVAVGITTWIAVEALINIASVVGWWRSRESRCPSSPTAARR